ncbi:hypothetical protein [Rummeliibacillus pycnus]|uniref:hypothetical protein n=1 Tax=Rummeliibacillus pycnus TaxID=101070 RepID=UPI000C9B5A2D|nr:hypothetical protein [Rummeliibacillus pycnus]
MSKKKMERFEEEREKWLEEKKSKIETNKLSDRTYYGSPTIGGVVVLLAIIIFIIVNSLNH